jgi:hypothetical protein
VTVTCEDFDKKGIPHLTTVELKMIETHLGCAATGQANACVLVAGGPTRP